MTHDSPHRRLAHVFAIVRSDPSEVNEGTSVTVTKVFAREEDAVREAARLNDLNGPKGVRYAVQITRFAPGEPIGADGAAASRVGGGTEHRAAG
jgi:hypothetical protein